MGGLKQLQRVESEIEVLMGIAVLEPLRGSVPHTSLLVWVVVGNPWCCLACRRTAPNFAFIIP